MAQNKKPAGQLSGGRGSTAGDVYHELWALRAALALLIPKTDLKAVTVEGVGTTSEDLYAAVDCGLFYGAPSLETASRIELVQLKYSTASPTHAWTVAKLTRSDGKKKNNSVIRGLAETFAEANHNKASGALLTIKMESNQPIAPEVITAIAALQTGKKRDAKATKLAAATGLKGTALKKFLAALSFAGMGGPGREGVQNAIALTIASMVESDIEATINQQRTRIRDLMLPGREEYITRETVLLWFGVASESGIFPNPPEFQPLGNWITRAPAKEVLQKIFQGSRLICVDGPGGCGKTTTIRQIEGLLPPGSLTITYDCYGAGRYLHSDHKRHLPENAFLQIVNELATAQGLPLLVPFASSKKADIISFRDRVVKSANLLTMAQPGGILAILIDAADNAVAAAEKWKDDCFVLDIATADLASLPSNVVIIFSTRTGRKWSLSLPANHTAVSCPPFDVAETRAYVDANVATSVDDEWVRQFHQFTDGVARVQSVAMEKGARVPSKVMQSLMPFGKGLKDVLKELLQEAAWKAGNDKFYNDCVAALSVLPPPIPLEHLAAICGVNEDAIHDFVRDVKPCLRIENNAVSISDEDVEDFLKEAGASHRTKIVAEACSVFRPMMDTDSYASTHYCDLLVAAGRAKEILSIVEGELEPKGIADPIIKREVQLRRLQLAMNACASAGNPIDTMKVALLGAEAAKDEAALRSLLEKNPKLSIRFAEFSLNRLVLNDQDRFKQQGAVLAQQAVKAAQDGDTIGSRERLYLYERWRREIQLLPHEKRHDVAFDWEDAAAVEHALILLNGVKSYMGRFNGFRLKRKILVGRALVAQLLQSERVDVLAEIYNEVDLPPLYGLVVTHALAMAGKVIDANRLAADLLELGYHSVPDVRKMRVEWQTELCELYVTLCEIAFSRGVAKSALLKPLGLLLNHRKTPSPKISRHDATRIDVALRAWLLLREINGHALEPAEFVAFCEETNAPQKPDPVDDKRQPLNSEQRQKAKYDQEEHEQLDRIARALFPVYRSRLEILKEAKSGKITGKPATAIPIVTDDYSFSREYQAASFRVALGLSIARLMHIASIDLTFLQQRALANAKSSSDGVTAYRSLPIWRAFLVRDAGQHEALVGVTARAKEMISLRVSANDKSQALLNFSELALAFSVDDAKVLFEQAIEIAKDVDRESMVQVNLIADLAKRVGPLEVGERLKLASRYAALVTDMGIRLEDEDYFPWQSAVEGMFDLSAEATLAALSQWHDEGLESLSRTLPVYVRKLSQDPNWVIRACGLSLLLDNASQETVKELAAKAAALDGRHAQDAMELLSKKIVFDVKPQFRAAFGRELNAHSSFVTSEQPISLYVKDLIQTQVSSSSAHSPKGKTPIIPFPPAHSLKTAADFQLAIASARRKLQGQYVSISIILSALRNLAASPNQRIPYLDAVSSISSDLNAGEHAGAIIDALAAWTGQLAVESWRSQVLPKFILKNFRFLAFWLSERHSRLPDLLEVTTLSDSEKVTLLSEALQQCAQYFGGSTLYAICDLMAKHLASNDAKALVSWYLERTSRHLLPDITDRFSPSEMPADLEEAVGRFVFAMLGDVDLRVRWRTAHFVRHVNALDGGQIFSTMMAQYDRKTDDAFRLKTAPYYWLSARLWSVMIASRIALESPSTVQSHVGKLFKIATDSELPHYLIKRHAKRAIEHLGVKGAVSLSATMKRSLKAVNQSEYPQVKEKGVRKGLDWTGGSGRRFSYNSLDTIPYWYSPLYQHIAKITPNEFFDAVEKWIVDQWGADKSTSNWDNETRKRRIRDADSMRAYNGHGSQPSLERYATYLEWHGMFCALGDILKKYPLAISEYDSDTLEHWVERWEPTEIDTWLFDRRSPPPLTPQFVVDTLGDDSTWLASNFGDEQFIQFALGVGSLAHSAVVYGEWTKATFKRVERVEVHSALASPSTALALLRALSGAKERFWLPTENEHHDFDEEPSEEPFKITPMVYRKGRDTEIDQDDPLRKEVTDIRVMPSAALSGAYQWKAEGSPTSKWVDAKGQNVLQYEAWSDSDDREAGSRGGMLRPLGLEGYRLSITKSELVRILHGHGMDLVIEVLIERRLENEFGERTGWDEKTKRKEVRKTYLFRQTGEIEGVNGPIGNWR